jgi:mannonate dehydratase
LILSAASGHDAAMYAGPRFSVNITPRAEANELEFARQLGADYVYTWVDEKDTTAEALTMLRRKVEAEGLRLYNVGCLALGKSDSIHLGLPDRDERIETFQRFVRNLGKAGIPGTTTTWEPDHVWRSDPRESRGARATAADMSVLERKPPTHGRLYSSEEVWSCFEYFIAAMSPVLAEAGVRLALHPNDPPVKEIGGIACLIHEMAGYERAFALADASVLGMEFCCGCWLEGGEAAFPIHQGIRRFVKEDRVALVHFRNVSSPLPRFTETFLDNGYGDMYSLMREFCAAGYEGPMCLDHTPRFAEPFHAGGGTAYAIGYMRALRERALADLGGRPGP